MEVKLIPIPYEGTLSGTKGASEGPKAVVNMLFEQIEDYDLLIDQVTFGKVNFVKEKELDVKNLAPTAMVNFVKNYMDKVGNVFPIVLGGGHSVSIGAIQSMKEKHENLTVVQIDAHLDLRDDDSDYIGDFNGTPSKYAHSCVMRRARDFGCDSVQVGIREVYSKEMEYLEKEGIKDKVFFCPVKDDVDKILSKIDSKNVYITLDVDGLDPSIMPGTGTPVQGGLDWHFVLKLLKKIFESKNVVGADIVEVSPIEGSHLTEKSAAQLVYHIAGLKYKNKKN